MKTLAAVALCAVAAVAMFSSCSSTKKVPIQSVDMKKIDIIGAMEVEVKTLVAQAVALM